MIQQFILQLVVLIGLSTTALKYINDYFKIKNNSFQWSFVVVAISTLASGIYVELLYDTIPSIITAMATSISSLISGLVAYFFYKNQKVVLKEFVKIWIAYRIVELVLAVAMYKIFGSALL